MKFLATFLVLIMVGTVLSSLAFDRGVKRLKGKVERLEGKLERLKRRFARSP
jgi:hypothetical protein